MLNFAQCWTSLNRSQDWKVKTTFGLSLIDLWRYEIVKLPVVDMTISLTEIPDKVTVVFLIGNCHGKCPGCHSEYLSIPLPKNSWVAFDIIQKRAQKQKNLGANAILLMGGTTNGIPLPILQEAIKRLSEILPVGLYSGASYNSTINKELRKNINLTWLKTGEFIEEKGGLDNSQTNQKFFVRDLKSKEWKDVTYLFQKS